MASFSAGTGDQELVDLKLADDGGWFGGQGREGRSETVVGDPFFTSTTRRDPKSGGWSTGEVFPLETVKIEGNSGNGSPGDRT